MQNLTRLIISAFMISAFVSVSFGPATALQTAKACEEQWKANKPSIQASGKKKKDFITECRGVVPTAAAPTKTTPTSSSSTTSAKACEEQWKTNKTSIQASGKTKKVFVGECRSGSVATTTPTQSAPAKPSTSNETKPASRPTAAPATAGTPTGANQYSTEAAAKFHCPMDAVVWINLKSGIYHFSGKKDYGTTKRGAYMCEKDTGASGFRAAKNEKHPA